MESPDAVVPTPDDRTIAMLAHVLQIFSGLWPPLIIYLVKRKSQFVAFHALQALLFQIVLLVGWTLAMGIFAAIFIFMMSQVGKSGESNGPPLALLICIPVIWGLLLSKWVLSVIVGIVYGIRASKGESAQYPIIGGWARRLAGYVMRSAPSPARPEG
ncbi:MAG: hypothetical protein DMG21_15465 [Acidobacteria bacterium]|nr:MAG: hypothetical protein DMG21_15465 [Acidobacteriota bacterium]